MGSTISATSKNLYIREEVIEMISSTASPAKERGADTDGPEPEKFQAIKERIEKAGNELNVTSWNEFSGLKELLEKWGGIYEKSGRDGGGTDHKVTYQRGENKLTIVHHAS